MSRSYLEDHIWIALELLYNIMLSIFVPLLFTNQERGVLYN
jgi:hypothetical protein